MLVFINVQISKPTLSKSDQIEIFICKYVEINAFHIFSINSFQKNLPLTIYNHFFTIMKIWIQNS